MKLSGKGQIAKHLGCSISTLDKRIAAGLPVERHGARVIVTTTEAVDAWELGATAPAPVASFDRMTIVLVGACGWLPRKAVRS